MAGTKKFTADKFVVDGGSSSGFLKADGSVDSTSYGTGNSSFSGSYDDLSDKPTIPTDTNTQLSEAEITAMGFIQTQSDTQDLSISGQTLSLTSGGSVTLPDTNTQLSDGDIAAFGYIKTDNNTQRTNAEIDARIALNPEGFIDAIPSAGAGVGTYGNAGNAYKIDHITLDAQGRVTAVSTGATGTTTASSIETFTNKSGSNSQWTNDEGYITSFTDTNTQLSDGDIAAFGYIKTFTDTNTQLSDANIATMGYIKTFTDTNTQRTNADIDARIALNPEGFIDSYTDTNTQLSDAEIAALGYIKTYTDTNTQLSDAQITALGYIKSYTDTNTQLSDSDIAAFGYIKTDTNTQLSDSDIAALGYIKTFTDTNTQLSDGDIGAFGYIKTYTDTNTQRTNEEIRDIAAGQWIDGTNTTVVYDDTSNTIKINSVNTDTNTQLSDANIAAMGYIKTESDTQDLSISGQTLSLTNGGSVTLPDTNTQLSSAQITAMGFSTTDNNTQRSDEEIRDVAAAQWIDGTNTTVVVSDAGDTIKINSVNTNTNTQLSEAEITAMGFIQTQSDTQDLSISGHTISLTNGGSVTVPDNNTQRTNSEIDARIALNPEGFIDSYTDTNTQLSDANIAAMGYIKTYTDTNTQRAIHDTPVNGSTTTSISSNWAFDNVKTAVPSGALFTDTDTNTQLSDANIGAMGYIKTYTDTNTQRAIHDTPVNGSTTTSISSNWAFDNVKTAVPSGALFTDTNTNTQLSSAQITAMGFSTTDNNTFRAISSTPVNGATTTSISSDWAFDNVKTAVPVNALFTDTNTNTQLSEANITAMGFIQSQSDSQTLSISGTTLSLTSGGSVTLPDNNDNTQLSQAEIEAMGFSTTDNNTFRAISSTPVNGATTTSISSDWAFDNVKTAVPAGALFTDTNTNTQLSSAQITAMGFSTTDNNDNTQLSEAEITAMGFIQSYTDTNTQLSDANIGAMGYIKTYTDTNTQLSEANITAMGFIQSYTDTNTQLSDGDIAGFGYIKTDTNTQLGDADIAAFGYIKTDTNTQLADGDIAAFGYIKTDTNTQLSEANITAMGFTQTVGTVGGSGAANRIPKFAAGGSDVTNSTITDSGTQVSISTGSLLLNNVTFN